ncbi:polymorphic toxin type 46 domain-containing protein [Pseudomonas sp. NPDC090202]|uniref:polymorphic toxin type 46 domain-containing protein n=1 Tax=unclassified Pseudomonas TaxID=196821 RepID=UPI0038043A11
MDLLAHVPSWDDIERNLDHKFSELNQSVNHGLQSAHDSWDGFTRRVSNGASQAYGYMGGHRIDNVRNAMALSYPIIQTDLRRKWASIEIEQILPVLLQLVKEVSMILGGSVAVGTIAGGAAGAFAFGVGAAPGAVAGAGIGLQIGNLILMALGLSAIAEYFYKGLPACLSSLQEGLATAWYAEDGLKPPGLDPSGGSAAQIQERTERAARQLARGQEQLVLLLLTAIVTYLTRGQMKAGVMNSMESIATRSARLQAEISNKQFANWLAKNEQKILAQPELQVKEPTPLKKVEPDPIRELPPSKPTTTPIEENVAQPLSRRDYLNQKFGRTGDLVQDINIRGNRETAARFFESQGYKPADYEGYMNGLDFSKPVSVETINSGKKLWQFQVPGGRQGMWYSPTPDVVPGQLGINPLGQIYKTETVVPKIINVYETTDKVTLLRSTSAPVMDTWSVPSQPFDAIGGARQMTSGQRDLFKLIGTGTP